MSSRPPADVTAAAVAAVLLLSGCTAPAPVPSTPPVSNSPDISPEPQPDLTPNPIDPDALLVIRATATAANGAQLSLEFQVHQSTPWDDVAAQAVPDVISEECPDLVNLPQFERERWSFTRSNITAIPPTGSGEWPTDAVIEARPSAQAGIVVGRGFLQNSDGPSSCQASKHFSSAGSGGMALALKGDVAESGDMTGWAQHAYGFRTGADVVLSDCNVEVKPLGRDHGASESSWSTAIDEHACIAGPAERLGE